MPPAPRDDTISSLVILVDTSVWVQAFAAMAKLGFIRVYDG